MSLDGRHRHPVTARLGAMISLVVALGAASAMLAITPPAPARPAGAEFLLAQEYPNRQITDVPGRLADGTLYTPMFFVDAQRSVGSAPTPDNRFIRLMLRGPDAEHELRRLPNAQAPDFGGFTTDGQHLAWLELTAGKDGQGASQIWTASLTGGGTRSVTTDTGDVLLFDKQDDMILQDGRVNWISATSTEGGSAIRSVPLTGGKVQIIEYDGNYALATWPWLVSEAAVDAGSVELRNMQSDERIVVGVQPGELLNCSPVWCRAVIIGSTASSTVIELMQPDGNQRQRTITGSVAAAIVDVALLDRYEIYSRSSPSETVRSSQLLLYDLTTGKLVLVADAVGQVLSRNGLLWWSSGDNETLTWHVLDLRAL